MKNFSILVIDDDLNIVDILRRAAKTVFPEAVFTPLTSFTQASLYLETLKGLAPKLVVLDLDLRAEHSGLDLLRALRLHPLGRLVPVVVLTANVEGCRDAYDLGASSVIKKPFSYAEWRTVIDQLRQYWALVAQVPDLWVDEDFVIGT